MRTRPMMAAIAAAASALVLGPSAPALIRAVLVSPAGVLVPLRPAPSPGPPGPEGAPIPDAPILAIAAWLKPNQTIDGIQCDRAEQIVYHIHAHLTIFVRGKARQIPYGIGITPPIQGQPTPLGPFVTSGVCFAWLHTHAADGIIHIESPTARIFTLGNFFDIWHQPLGPNRVGPARGHVTAFLNGEVFSGNPRSIQLLKHAQIQLDVGNPLIAPEEITFSNNL